MGNGKIINFMNYKIIPIQGDASFRKFYRFIKGTDSKIIVEAKREKYKNLIAYCAINKFLKTNNILTPKLYNHNYSKGIMIIEDFGDKSFYKILINKKEKLSTYKSLVNLLLKIQKIKPKFKIKSLFGKTHVVEEYSNKHLIKESNLFFDWYLPLFLSKKKSKKIKKKSNKILLKLYKKLNFPNAYFVHRDYHVQNLMKINKKIGLLDSQDALIGNPAYDLVSLIDDVRIKTSQKLRGKILKYYLKKSKNINKKNSEKFLEDFNILSVQRGLKIIGIFSRLYKRDSKKQYLKFIPYMWELLEQRMNTKAFADLKKIIDKNIQKKIKKNSKK